MDLHLQPTPDDQATPRRQQMHAQGLEVSAEQMATACFGHNFSRIPIYAPTPVRLQAKLAVNTPGDSYEQEAESRRPSVTGA